MSRKVVSFHDNPPSNTEKSKYKDAIKKAKENQKDRPSDLQNTPRFDQTTAWSEGSSDNNEGSFLSEDTKKGLESLARAAKAEEKQKVTQQEPVKEDIEDEDLSPEDKLKKAIESRLDPIDVGEYLMSGELRQTVIIIPNKLKVTFKTVSDQEESFVDNEISGEDASITNRQFLRKMNGLALAIHIYSVNGTKWPTLLNGDGTVNDKSVAARMKHIRKLSSPVFTMLGQNLAWFNERVSNALTTEALGNG